MQYAVLPPHAIKKGPARTVSILGKFRGSSLWSGSMARIRLTSVTFKCHTLRSLAICKASLVHRGFVNGRSIQWRLVPFLVLNCWLIRWLGEFYFGGGIIGPQWSIYTLQKESDFRKSDENLAGKWDPLICRNKKRSFYWDQLLLGWSGITMRSVQAQRSETCIRQELWRSVLNIKRTSRHLRENQSWKTRDVMSFVVCFREQPSWF